MTPEVYRHYNGSLYVLLHIAFHTEKGKGYAVYTAANGSVNTVWACPLRKFFDKVEVEGKQVSRFEKVE